ncbi:MAG: AAA-like domain-containing protein [Cyanobacteria bacterium J06560_6]
MAAPNYDYVYQPGGSLGFRAPSYVERKADTDLYESIKAGKFCYVFNCRQMGKSSLRVRVGNRLKQEGYRCAALDLTKVGGDDYLSPGQWYRSLITDLNRSLSLLSDTDFDDWLAKRDDLTSAYVLSQFIEDVVLVETREESVVIFIDEIDNVLSLSFDTTDLFAVIRSCYNERADNVEYARLNFSLLGVATPAQLMRNTSRTPFNIGKAIRLTPLELSQAQPLESGLLGWAESPEQVLKAIFQWTGGQPYLTQRLCELVQEDAMENGAVVMAAAADKVAELVAQHILKNWQLKDEQNHLKTIQDRMLRQGHLVNRVLDLYAQVLKQGELVARSTDEATIELRLSGAVIQTEQTLKPFNQIYQRIFNIDWVAETLANLRPHAATFDVWVASGYKDTDSLLRGDRLRTAEAWAVGKSLSDQDNRYLRESQTFENRTFQKRAKIGSIVFATVMSAILAILGISIFQAKKTLSQTQEKASIFREASEWEKQSSVALNTGHKSLVQSLLKVSDAGWHLLDGVKQLEKIEGNSLSLSEYPTSSPPRVLQALLNRTVNQTLLTGHEKGVRDSDFSPDGQRVVTASIDGTARIWDVQTGQPLVTLRGHKKGLLHVEFSPDGKRVVTASIDGTARIWDIDTGEYISLIEHTSNSRSPAWIRHAKFSPNGKLIVTVFNRKNIRVWDAITGKVVFTLQGHDRTVEDASFSPDSQRILTASVDGTARIWSVDTGESIATLKVLTQREVDSSLRTVDLPYRKASYSADGQRIVTDFAVEATIQLWAVQTGEPIARLKKRNFSERYMAISPNGSQVLTAFSDGTTRLWNVDTEEIIATLKGHNENILHAEFSSDGQQIITTSEDGLVQLWDINHEEPIATLQGHELPAKTAKFSFDGQQIITASGDGTARLWDISEENTIVTQRGDDGKIPVGQRVIADSILHTDNTDVKIIVATQEDYKGGGRRPARWIPSDSTIYIRDMDSDEVITTLQSHGDDSVSHAAFSYDSKRIVTVSSDGSARIWDTSTGKIVVTLEGQLHLEGQSHLFLRAKFSPAGNYLAMVVNGFPRIWSVRSGRVITTLDVDTSPMRNVRIFFSPDEKRVVTTSGDNADVWNTNTGAHITTLQDHGDAILWAEFSPDGKRIVTSSNDYTARVWDVNTASAIITLRGHKYIVNRSMFTPDGQRIYTSSGDGTSRLWDLNTGESVVLPHDYTSSGDGTSRVWDLNTGESILRPHDLTFFFSYDHAVSGHTSFSDDSRRLMTTFPRGTTKYWPLIAIHHEAIAEEEPTEDLETLLNQSCDWLRNYLTYSPDRHNWPDLQKNCGITEE